MIAPARRSLFLTALAAAVALALLITSGLLVRRYVADAFAAYESTYQMKELADAAVKLQLDQETGIRGLAATGDREFLEPYAEAVGPLERSFEQLDAALRTAGLADALPVLADARKTHATWSERVAKPILTGPRRNALRIEQYGKQLVDHYRLDFENIDFILRGRDRSVNEQVRRSIDRINVFLALFVALLALGALAYAALQIRVSGRLAEQERVAADERRQRAELRAAYEAEKRVADTLQEAFTQRSLPLLEPLRFSASYVPATEDTKVGGDWYDAMALSNNRVLFAIGDVTGHGIEAAVTMNQARQLLLSAALVDSDPASILSRVNAEISNQSARLVTAIAGIADAKKYEFTYAVAGHPPPVLLEPGRPPRFLECGSVALGALPFAGYVTRRIQSVPGAMLVLYTDGAVEHSRNVLEGEELLLKAVAEAAEQSELDQAAFIHHAIFAGRSVGDDVAILTVGFSGEKDVGLIVSADNAQTAFSGRIEDSPAASQARQRQVRNLWPGAVRPRGIAS
jgi:serine phosphatase RsbU (regulator of sigma subunit)